MLSAVPSERVLAAEIAYRKELLVNYLQTVLRHDDERLQRLLLDMRRDASQQRPPNAG